MWTPVQPPMPDLQGTGLTVGIVVARYNWHITGAMLHLAQQTLIRLGVVPDNIHVHFTPGAFELATVAQAMLINGDYDAIICFGCVMKGETRHDVVVSDAAAQGIQMVALNTQVPIIFGVMCAESQQQAEARIGRGTECAEAAVEMALTMQRLKNKRRAVKETRRAAMFTGIIEEVGTLKALEPTAMVIQAHLVLQDATIKDSIAVDGVCLTVTAQGEDWFRVDTMPETQRRTRFSSLLPGASMNLERSLAVNGRMGGHMVQGHIEATASILAIEQDGIGRTVEVELSEALRPYVVAKGFIAINGVSLTVVECKRDRFSIALIPYTREHTNLGQLHIGASVNLETDILGRYVVQFLRQQSGEIAVGNV